MDSAKGEAEKTEDKLEIDREERERILSRRPEASEAVDASKIKTEFKEGMEIKPKKIPIGGIQMPGFFMRSRSKEKCKETDSEAPESEVEGTELLTRNEEEKDVPEDSLMNQSKVKLPIRKKMEDNISDEKNSEQIEKHKLFDRLCKPLASILPKNKKETEKNLENQVAGLASVETLDDDKFKKDSSDGAKDNQTWTSICIKKLKTYHLVISALGIFVILVSAIVFFTVAGKNVITKTVSGIDGSIVETITSCGKVEGVHRNDAVAFRGIPYARPPLGELRFRAARPLDRIEYCHEGVLRAHDATPPCLQLLANGTVRGVEDCLTLDVVTPYVRYRDPLPVVVLVGAETLAGAAPAKLRPSARYARGKDVVFVRPNFRLGALGFLKSGALREYPGVGGNYGLSDVVEALRWVQRNVVHFGGDPKSVTLVGHRAGATLVTVLSTIREAPNLFHRAWASSPSASLPTLPLEESEKDDRSYLEMLPCDSATAKDKITCLRELNATVLTESIEDTWRQPLPDLPAKDEVPEKRHQWLVMDGRYVTESPYEVLKSKPKVPLVVGATSQNLATEKLLLKYTEWNESLVSNHIKNSVLSELNLTDAVLKLYPKTYKGLVTLISDLRSICPLYEIYKSSSEMYFYVVTQARENNLADIDSDVDAILGRYEPKTPEQRRYFSAIQQFFYRFVWQGTVDEQAIGNVMIVDQDVHIQKTYGNCDFWINNNMTSYAQLD